MAKVLLIAPSYLDLYGKLSRAAGRYFPLGLGYIAAYLRAYSEHSVTICEAEAQGLSDERILQFSAAYSPDIIGVTCSTPNFGRAIRIARLLRESSKAKIVLGGVHASAMPDYIVEAHAGIIDCIVVGEGERTMLDLANAWSSGRSLSTVPGIVFLENGMAVRTAERPYIENLDSLPHPARDLVPQHLFRPNLHNARYRPCISILTSRGCPFGCSFCAARVVSGKRYRCHSPEYVLDEMEMLRRDYGARQLLITDDTFTLDRQRLETICRGMVDRRLNLKWFCFSQVTAVDAELLRLMVRAGCYSIGFGVESADRDILREMGKPIDPARALEAVHAANKVGIKTQAFYVLGMPGETLAQMQATIRFSKRVGSTLAFYNMLVPYPGTAVFRDFFEGVPLEEISWDDFVAVGMRCVLEKSTVPAAQILRLLADANWQYYLHPRRLAAVLLQVRTPYELVNYLRGGVSLARQILAWRG